MPQLLRLRFVSLGHPQARMEDVVLDFQGTAGQPTDSTLWLRNGGGKSSILNLFFAIVRPHKGEFLGGKAEAKQRSLSDYVLAGDRAVAAAEWQLDPAADSLGLESKRFVTGVFYERRDGSGDLRRLFFSCRSSSEHAESTLAGLPLYTSTNGVRTRRTLGAFRETWRSLRDRAPHLGVADTENQREWQEILDAARIDPELFSYQVRMNQREGGADELFRFAEPEDFVDFLLELALDPALGDRVGKNITAFRRELLQRREQLVPERDLVVGLLSRMEAVLNIRERRGRLRAYLGEAREDIESLGRLAGSRIEELWQKAEELDGKRKEHLAAAEEHGSEASRKRARAAQLRRHGAELRLKRLEEEHEQVQKEWQTAQRLAKIWAAAVPLRRVLQFEEKARDQRRSLEERETEHAPLRADLEGAAERLASALTFRSQEHRKTGREARTAEGAAHEEARGYRRQALEASKVESEAETQAKNLHTRLAEVDAKRERLIRDGVLGADEDPDACASRWTGKVKDHEDAIERLDAEMTRLDGEIAALEPAITTASQVVSERQSDRKKLADRLGRARSERAAIEGDPVLRAALELEVIDADRIGADAIHTVEQAARAEQRVVVEARLAVADDERAALHIEEHGLLPPSADAQRVVDFLVSRLGGQAWSGWSWIAANIPKQHARDVVRQAPSLAQGVVVRPADLERAMELLEEAGVEPDGPLLIAATDALTRAQEVIGRIAGPKETAWFDRDIAQKRLAELQVGLDGHRQRIQVAEEKHRELTRSCETLRSFRNRYSVGWFADAEEELRTAEGRETEAQDGLLELQEEKRRKAQLRKDLEGQRREQVRGLQHARDAGQRVVAFVEDYARPSVGWRAELREAIARAERAREDVRQWSEMAEGADSRASEASVLAQQHGEEARLLENERDGLEYVVEDVGPAPGPIDELRDRYRLLKDQYEEKVGAKELLALANQSDEIAKAERARLARVLSPEITEALVREHLDQLPEPDTVEELRQDAEGKASSLQGKMGNLKGRIEPAAQAVQQAEDALKLFGILSPLQRAPSTPELSEAEAGTLEGEAKLHQNTAESEQANANAAKQQSDALVQRRADIERHVDRLRALRDDYPDLLEAGERLTAREIPASLEESMLPSQIKKLSDGLRKARSDWQALDTDRGVAASALRAFASGPVFERLEAVWLRRLQEHDDPALEDASEDLCGQLDLRKKVLEDQITGIERHRAILVDELHAVAEEGMKLLRQASSLSKLPDHVPGIGGAHFLRIQTQEPADPSERRARLAELIDDLLDGQRDLGFRPVFCVNRS